MASNKTRAGHGAPGLQLPRSDGSSFCCSMLGKIFNRWQTFSVSNSASTGKIIENRKMMFYSKSVPHPKSTALTSFMLEKVINFIISNIYFSFWKCFFKLSHVETDPHGSGIFVF